MSSEALERAAAIRAGLDRLLSYERGELHPARANGLAALDALLAEVASQPYETERELVAALAVAREREQRLREAATAYLAELDAGRMADDDEIRALLADEPAAARRTLRAEREFLAASIAVWRSIDEREAMPGGYSAQPLTRDTELRHDEREAWHRYRDAIADEPAAATLAEPETPMTTRTTESAPSVSQSQESARASIGSGSASAAADEPACICPRFGDLPEGTIIADLTCPVHGVNGTDPGDVLPAEYAAADEPGETPCR